MNESCWLFAVDFVTRGDSLPQHWLSLVWVCVIHHHLHCILHIPNRDLLPSERAAVDLAKLSNKRNHSISLCRVDGAKIPHDLLLPRRGDLRQAHDQGKIYIARTRRTILLGYCQSPWLGDWRDIDWLPLQMAHSHPLLYEDRIYEWIRYIYYYDASA